MRPNIYTLRVSDEHQTGLIRTVTLRLRTFGSVSLARHGASLTGVAGQRRQLAILSVLATAGEWGISRDRLLALLWSEGDPDKSRHALTQSLYHTRKAFGSGTFLSGGSDLRLDPAILTSDVGDLQRAIADRRSLIGRGRHPLSQLVDDAARVNNTAAELGWRGDWPMLVVSHPDRGR
jgi:hypothetical protein